MKVLVVGMSISIGEKASVEAAPSLPLGAAYVVAYAKKDPLINKNIVIELLRWFVGKDCIAYQSDEYLLQQILIHDPDVVAFSCYIWNINRIKHVTRCLKAIAPKIKIVWGGPDVSFCPEELLKDNPATDFVVCGEGEVTFTELLKALYSKKPDFHKVLGIAYRQGGQTHKTRPRPTIANLEEVPSPYLSGVLDLREKPENGRMMLEGMRNCAFRCGYCLSPGRVRYFPIERVRQEIELFFNSKGKAITIIDPLINLHKDRLQKLSEIFYSISPRQAKTGAAIVMAELLDTQSVKALKRIHPSIIEFGLQSTNPEVTKNILRRFDSKKFENAVALLKGAGLPFHIQLIAGLPGDTLDGLKRTIEFAVSLKPDFVSCFTALLLKGSYLYEQRKPFKIVFDEQAPYRIFSHYSLDYDQLLKCAEYGIDVCTSYNESSTQKQARFKLPPPKKDTSRQMRYFNTMEIY